MRLVLVVLLALSSACASAPMQAGHTYAVAPPYAKVEYWRVLEKQNRCWARILDLEQGIVWTGNLCSLVAFVEVTERKADDEAPRTQAER